MVTNLRSIVICLGFYASLVTAFPAEYCNVPFNGSDCGQKPEPVFSYYKPGSRCEIEYWRGCPTLNRFASATTCSYFCISKLDFPPPENNVVESGTENCTGVFDGNDCFQVGKVVYTFNNEKKKCEEAVWKGCASNNLFEDMKSCEAKCEKAGNGTDALSWQKDMEKLTNNDIDNVNDILDTLLDEDTQQDTKQDTSDDNQVLADVETTTVDPYNLQQPSNTNIDETVGT